MLSNKLALMMWQVISGHVADTWKHLLEYRPADTIEAGKARLIRDQSGRWFSVQGNIYGKIFMNPEFISYNLLGIRLSRGEYL